MKYVTMMLTLALMASPASALGIRNLSGESQVLVMEQSGNRDSVVLEEGQSLYLMTSTMQLSIAGKRPVTARFDEEFVIWPGGDLIIQKRQKTMGISR